MKTTAQHNFHVPLSTPVYHRLRALAESRRIPATQLVKQAVEYWLEEQEKHSLHEEIARYAAENAGSSNDLDEQFEAAGLETIEKEHP